MSTISNPLGQTMQRKHVIFFTVVTLICVVALILFQVVFGDGGYLGGAPQEATTGP